VGEATLHYFVNLDAQVLSGRYFLKRIPARVFKIFVIEAGDDFPSMKPSRSVRLQDHASLLIDGPAGTVTSIVYCGRGRGDCCICRSYGSLFSEWASLCRRCEAETINGVRGRLSCLYLFIRLMGTNNNL